MAILLAVSITYLDDKKAILKHWSDIDAPEYHTTISEDLNVLRLPGAKKERKWIDADGIVSLWWIRPNSDSEDVQDGHNFSKQLKQYVNPKEGSKKAQTLLLCKIKSITVLEEKDVATPSFVPMTREKPSSTATVAAPQSHSSPEVLSTVLESTASNSTMTGDSGDKREEGEIIATPPPPLKRRRPLAMEVGNDFTLPTKTMRESALEARINELEAELAAERRRRRDCERALDDIRRECRHPFVVPAIFDAVLAVSKLTNQLHK